MALNSGHFVAGIVHRIGARCERVGKDLGFRDDLTLFERGCNTELIVS